MEPPVQTEALTKRYGGTAAVQDLDLIVRPGEVYGFLGPNGAGKTTTLRMLLGLVRPSAGRVRLFGRPPGAGGLAGVGALIEGPAFDPYLSGRTTCGCSPATPGWGRTGSRWCSTWSTSQTGPTIGTPATRWA